MATRNQQIGIVSPVPMGEWQANEQYQKLNLVRSHKATYQAKKANQGIEPTVTVGWQEVWQIISSDGRGVVSTQIDYQAGVSGTIPPNGEWVEDVPKVQGQYLWTRTIYTFTDGTQTLSYSVSLQGLNFTQQDKDDIDRIVDAIPSTASADNLIATENFVNSTVNNMSAFYITFTQGSSSESGQAFPTHASLVNATTFYSGGKTRVPTQNDYATVLADETQPKGVDGSYPTTRYVYQTNEVGGTYPNGQWDFQYIVNNTSLTQAQVDAINSGITQELVSKFNKAYSPDNEPGVLYYLTTVSDELATVRLNNIYIPKRFRIEWYASGNLVAYTSAMDVDDASWTSGTDGGHLNFYALGGSSAQIYYYAQGAWMDTNHLNVSSYNSDLLYIAWDMSLVGNLEGCIVYLRCYQDCFNPYDIVGSIMKYGVTPISANYIGVDACFLSLACVCGVPFAYSIATIGKTSITGSGQYTALNSVGAISDLGSFTVSRNISPTVTNNEPYIYSIEGNTSTKYTFRTIPLYIIPTGIVDFSGGSPTIINSVKFTLTGDTLNIDTY